MHVTKHNKIFDFETLYRCHQMSIRGVSLYVLFKSIAVSPKIKHCLNLEHQFVSAVLNPE